MADYDLQCLLCGGQFDGTLHVRPDNCPYCDGPESEIVDADYAEDMELENMIINKQDEFREDMKDEQRKPNR